MLVLTTATGSTGALPASRPVDWLGPAFRPPPASPEPPKPQPAAVMDRPSRAATSIDRRARRTDIRLPGGKSSDTANVTRDPPGSRNRGRTEGPRPPRPPTRAEWLPRSVGVLSAVVLEDPSGQRESAQPEADDHQPPGGDRRGVHDHAEQRGTPQGPPGVRREEPQLAGPVGDL